MLRTACSLFGQSSEIWDTSYARQFLKISDEDMKLLNAIPGWSLINQTSKTLTPEKTSNYTAAEKPQSSLQTANSVALTHQCNLLQKDKSEILSTEKNNFMKCVSLHPNQVAEVTTHFHGEHSNLFPNVRIPRRKRSRSESCLQDVTAVHNTTLIRKHRSNLTLSELEGKTNVAQTDDTFCKISSNSAKKLSIEKLEDNILDHPFLKLPSSSTECNLTKLVSIVIDNDHENLPVSKLDPLASNKEAKLTTPEKTKKYRINLKNINCLKVLLNRSKSVEVAGIQTSVGSANTVHGEKEVDSSKTILNTEIAVASPIMTSSKENESTEKVSCSSQFQTSQKSLACSSQVEEAVASSISDIKSSAALPLTIDPIVVHITKTMDTQSLPDVHVANQLETKSPTKAQSVEIFASQSSIILDRHSSVEFEPKSQLEVQSTTTSQECLSQPASKLHSSTNNEPEVNFLKKSQEVEIHLSSDSDTHFFVQSNLVKQSNAESPSKSILSFEQSGVVAQSATISQTCSSELFGKSQPSISINESESNYAKRSTGLKSSVVSESDAPALLQSKLINSKSPLKSALVQSGQFEVQTSQVCLPKPCARPHTSPLASIHQPEKHEFKSPESLMLPESNTEAFGKSSLIEQLYTQSPPRHKVVTNSNPTSPRIPLCSSSFRVPTSPSSLEANFTSPSKLMRKSIPPSECKPGIVPRERPAKFSIFSDIDSSRDTSQELLSSDAKGKRKRLSKSSNKPRKRISLSNPFTRIQYTAEQVKNMFQILKAF